MDAAGDWIVRRLANSTITNATGIVSQVDTDNANATRVLINDLIFAESRSVRTSTIILGAFNICAALLTAGGILYDCYWASKRASKNGHAEKFCVSKIHPAETFPLVLALGIAIQGAVFTASQSTGLQSIYVSGCGTIGQLVFPAIFFVFFIQLVFGLECAFRSFKTLPFQARGKYDVTICIVVVLLMTAGTWVPTFLYQEDDYCFGSLVWFVARWGMEGLILLIVVASLGLVSAIIIYHRCATCSLIDQHQRIAASRMVYYLSMAVITVAFVIPWFATLTSGKPSLTTSMMATVLLNLSGLLNGALHIFLRANTVATSFCPKEGSGWSGRKHEIRIWGPNELGFDGHLAQPVSGPRPESRSSLMRAEKTMSIESMPSPQYVPSSMKVQVQYDEMSMQSPRKPEAAKMDSLGRTNSRRYQRKLSYTVFPGRPTSPVGQQLLPATTFGTVAPGSPGFSMPISLFADHGAGDGLESIYIASDLEPPPKIKFGGENRHARNSSMASSATVQIGLRLSHAINNEPLPSLNPNNSQLSIGNAQAKPNPLQIQTRGLAPVVTPSRSPFRQSPLTAAIDQAIDEARPSISRSSSIDRADREQRMKTLPRVPRIESTVSRLSRTESVCIQLSPTVYTPVSAAPSRSPKLEEARVITPPPRIGLPSRPGPLSPRQALTSSPVKHSHTLSPTQYSPGKYTPGQYTPSQRSPAQSPRSEGNNSGAVKSDWI